MCPSRFDHHFQYCHEFWKIGHPIHFLRRCHLQFAINCEQHLAFFTKVMVGPWTRADQWSKHILRIFSTELFRMNSLTRSAVSKNRAERSFFFLRREPRNLELVTLVARQREHFRVFFGDFFWLLDSFHKRYFGTQESLLVNDIVTASSHALWRVPSKKVIWVLGHCWVDTPHIYIFEVDSVLSKLFAPHCHGHAEWFKFSQQKRFY